jgi:hypothetical protein
VGTRTPAAAPSVSRAIPTRSRPRRRGPLRRRGASSRRHSSREPTHRRQRANERGRELAADGESAYRSTWQKFRELLVSPWRAGETIRFRQRGLISRGGEERHAQRHDPRTDPHQRSGVDAVPANGHQPARRQRRQREGHEGPPSHEHRLVHPGRQLDDPGDQRDPEVHREAEHQPREVRRPHAPASDEPRVDEGFSTRGFWRTRRVSRGKVVQQAERAPDAVCDELGLEGVDEALGHCV